MRSIQAFRSQNNAYACGPLNVHVAAEDGDLAHVAGSFFALYSRAWARTTRDVRVTLTRESREQRARGTFLTCAHMSVDRTGVTYLADTQYGFVAAGRTSADADEWTISVPFDTVFDEPQIGDMEDVFSLVCTVGWRAEGFVAVHAAAVAKNGRCALLCTGSGGGKSTLTTALVLGGWSTLGDDKLLLRREHGVPVLRSLLQTFNLDPATRRWFDLGDLESLPRYSAWTQKRRVPLDRVRPGAGLELAHPTHVVSVTRAHGTHGIGVRELAAAEVAATLLRQIALPGDVDVTRWTMTETIACAARVRGVQLAIGDDAYAQPGWLQTIESALR